MTTFRRLVTPDELERRAFDAQGEIHFPPDGKAGLATLDVDGRGFAARVPAAGEGES